MDNLNVKCTILFVDDEQIVMDVGTMMIKKLGYRVLQATSGTEASQVFSDNLDDIVLVLLDINLPDEMGIDTCIRLKRMDPYVKVIHTSGMGESADQTLACGCAKFLPKPFKIEKLSNYIKEYLEAVDDQEMPASHFI